MEYYMIKALAFDLFGTLIDNASISKIFPDLDIRVDPKLFLETWRSKHLQYAWLLTILNRYEPFSELSIRALRFTTKIYHIELTDGQIRKLTEARMHLDPFPDSKKGLVDLKKMVGNKKLVYSVLSNGEADITNKILSNTGLREYFDHVLSGEAIRKYKPSTEAYMIASDILGIPLSEILMISSHTWDIAGAQSAGMLTCLIDRGESSKMASDQIEISPNYILSSIEGLNEIKELLVLK
jgi:2-haloacid dehalogenase